MGQELMATYNVTELIAQLPIAVCVCEAPTGIIRFYNQRAVDLWGREPQLAANERFSGAPQLLHVDGTSLPHAETAMAEVLRDGDPREAEAIIVRPDGSRITVLANIAALRDADGRIVGAVNTFQDVTDRKKSDEAAARLAAIVANADDAIVSKTLDGIITSWNRGAERIFGYTELEVLGKSITLIIPAERLHEEDEILGRLKRGEVIDHFETERVAKDGRRVAISLTMSPVKDRGGRVVGVSKVARDVTEQKRAAEALRQSERDLSDFFDNAVVGLHWVGPDGTILRANKAELAMLGYTAAEYVGRNIAEFHADDPTIDSILQRLKSGESLHNQPARLRCKDGSIREVLISSNVLWVDGEFIRTRCFTRDVTDLRLMEREREALAARERSALAQAQAANQAKDEFLAMLAHELRNPLGVIGNALALLDVSEDAQAQRDRVRNVLRRQTDHLARLLDDLLDVARITSGRIDLDRERVDLRSIAQHAVDTERHRFESKRQELILSLGTEPVMIDGDPVRLQQILGNLLINASKYTPVGGSICVALMVEQDAALLCIRDNGVGIPVDKLESIFDLFTQANPSLARTEGGLGVGLTLVRRLVELHGGSAHASSEGPGHGSEFAVRLPLASGAALPSSQAAPPLDVASQRVLVIEDNDDGREMLVTLLRVLGHEVFEAGTGKEGIEIALRHSPSVVVLDIGLPDLDGYEVGRHLRERLGGGLRLVALTGYGQPQDRALSQSVGFDAHLVKPVDPRKLAEALRRPT